jgi:hypothetical protein
MKGKDKVEQKELFHLSDQGLTSVSMYVTGKSQGFPDLAIKNLIVVVPLFLSVLLKQLF